MMILGTKNRLWNLGRIGFLALALLFVLAACSDNGDDTVPTQTSPTATATAEPEAMTPTPRAASTPTDSPPTATAEPEAITPALKIVATTGIVADWVENIGGDHVEVFSLVPTGADPHTFQPGAQDVARIADADLVLSIGLGLEEAWLTDLLENTARDPSTIVELAELIEPIEFAQSHIEEVELIEELSHIVHEVEEGEISPEEGLEEIRELLESAEEEEAEGEHHGEEDELPAMVMAIIQEVEDGQTDPADAIEAIEHLISEEEEGHEGHGHGIEDPHFWFDPIRVKTAVTEIASRLSELDPGNAGMYFQNVTTYGEELDQLHAWTEQQVSAVPEDRRLLVTSHDSLGYFANLYHFEVVGVILSITTDVEPSAEHLAELTHEVEELGVPAVFGETTVSERLAQTVATESGAILVRLYSGSLGTEDSGAGTYIDMVRTNVERIVEALR